MGKEGNPGKRRRGGGIEPHEELGNIIEGGRSGKRTGGLTDLKEHPLAGKPHPDAVTSKSELASQEPQEAAGAPEPAAAEVEDIENKLKELIDRFSSGADGRAEERLGSLMGVVENIRGAMKIAGGKSEEDQREIQGYISRAKELIDELEGGLSETEAAPHVESVGEAKEKTEVPQPKLPEELSRELRVITEGFSAAKERVAGSETSRVASWINVAEQEFADIERRLRNGEVGPDSIAAINESIATIKRRIEALNKTPIKVARPTTKTVTIETGGGEPAKISKKPIESIANIEKELPALTSRLENLSGRPGRTREEDQALREAWFDRNHLEVMRPEELGSERSQQLFNELRGKIEQLEKEFGGGGGTIKSKAGGVEKEPAEDLVDALNRFTAPGPATPFVKPVERAIGPEDIEDLHDFTTGRGLVNEPAPATTNKPKESNHGILLGLIAKYREVGGAGLKPEELEKIKKIEDREKIVKPSKEQKELFTTLKREFGELSVGPKTVDLHTLIRQTWNLVGAIEHLFKEGATKNNFDIKLQDLERRVQSIRARRSPTPAPAQTAPQAPLTANESLATHPRKDRPWYTKIIPWQ